MNRLICAAVAMFVTAALPAAQTRDYAGLHDKLVKFYQYQRAGLKTGSANNANADFTNAAHNGDNYNGNPLDGGWYDAGDYVKFGMNLSYSLYCLLKGYDVFRAGYATASGSVPDILVQAKFATDYLCKAVIDANTIVLDVGTASSKSEHDTWAKATNTTGRSGGDIHLCDGGDIPATYAACLALMSVLYRRHDAAYADTCLANAKIAFTFAKNKFNANKNYCTAQTKQGAALYDYPTPADGKKSQQISDRMVAAGVELYRATLGTTGADPLYKAWAKSTITQFFTCAGYAYIGPLASFEAWRQDLVSGPVSLSGNITFIKGRLQTSGTFNKVFQNTDWGTARDIGTVAFEYALAYVATSDTSVRKTYLQNVTDHVDWVAGYIGGQSYVCGFNNGPESIHYRTTNYGAIPGAVVSGPDDQGEWDDNGRIPQYCEVAIDYNAGITGAVAFLKVVKDDSAPRQTKAFSATPTIGVDLTSTAVALSAAFSKSIAWSISINGNFGSKVIKGSGTTINAAWDGGADNGFFLAGEIVKAKLTIEGDLSPLDLVLATPVSIEIAKAKKVAPKPGDTLIDDFEVRDSTNDFGGTWISYGTGVGLLATTFTYTAQDGSTAITLNGNVKTPGPATFSGLKTTFKADGTPCAIGPVKSVFFDLKSSIPANARVELEQSDITDGAYYGITIPVSDLANSYRLDIANFTQADWATAEKALDLTKITALRFTVYDSTGIIKLHLDNLAIEGSVGCRDAVTMPRSIHVAGKPVFFNNTLRYTSTGTGPVRLSIFDMSGRMRNKRAIRMIDGESTVKLGDLPAGMYTAVYSNGGGERIGQVRFFVGK